MATETSQTTIENTLRTRPEDVESGFGVMLTNFSGPLDLLVYLIGENEVEITEIPVAHILEQYLIYLKSIEEIDINLAGDFLVMAARLMEIKARTVVPRGMDEDDEELEEIDLSQELVQELLEFQRCKKARLDLRAMLDRHQERMSRLSTLQLYMEEAPEEEDDLKEISMIDLLQSYETLQHAIMATAPVEITNEISLAKRIEGILGMLHDGARKRFTDFISTLTAFFKGSMDSGKRADAAATFMAILELCRRKSITVSQSQTFGLIMVNSRSEELSDIALAHERLGQDSYLLSGSPHSPPAEDTPRPTKRNMFEGLAPVDFMEEEINDDDDEDGFSDSDEDRRLGARLNRAISEAETASNLFEEMDKRSRRSLPMLPTEDELKLYDATPPEERKHKISDALRARAELAIKNNREGLTPEQEAFADEANAFTAHEQAAAQDETPPEKTDEGIDLRRVPVRFYGKLVDGEDATAEPSTENRSDTPEDVPPEA